MTAWRGLLARHPREARGGLRLLLPKSIMFTPRLEGERRGYEFRAKVAIGFLVSGVLDPTSVAFPDGGDEMHDVKVEGWFAAEEQVRAPASRRDESHRWSASRRFVKHSRGTAAVFAEGSERP
jgi:hypothetical protein